MCLLHLEQPSVHFDEIEKLRMISDYQILRDNGADIHEAYIETLRSQIEP